jgi:hypothetical protein
VSIQLWCNTSNTDREKLKYWDKTLLQCHYICQFSHMEWPRIVSGYLRWEAGNYKIWDLFHPVSYTFTMYKEQIIFHLILTFGTSFRWVVSFMFWQLYPSQGVGVELYFASSVCLLDLVLKIKHRTTFMELIQT